MRKVLQMKGGDLKSGEKFGGEFSRQWNSMQKLIVIKGFSQELGVVPNDWRF